MQPASTRRSSLVAIGTGQAPAAIVCPTGPVLDVVIRIAARSSSGCSVSGHSASRDCRRALISTGLIVRRPEHRGRPEGELPPCWKVTLPRRYMNAAICRRVTTSSGQYRFTAHPRVMSRFFIQVTCAQNGSASSTSRKPAQGAASRVAEPSAKAVKQSGDSDSSERSRARRQLRDRHDRLRPAATTALPEDRNAGCERRQAPALPGPAV